MVDRFEQKVQRRGFISGASWRPEIANQPDRPMASVPQHTKIGKLHFFFSFFGLGLLVAFKRISFIHFGHQESSEFSERKLRKHLRYISYVLYMYICDLFL